MSEWQRGTIGELAKGYRGVTYSAGQLLEFKAHDTVTLLRSNNISRGQLNVEDVQIVSERLVSEDQLLTPGDIAVCMSNGSKALVGKSAQLVTPSEERFTIGAFCSVFRPQPSANSRFAAYVFQSSSYRNNLDLALAGTAINNLRNADVEAFACDIPPYEEQSRIAQILDTLDTVIRETETLIDKLKALKQGLLHDLLTRGIDANGQLRPPKSEAPQLYKESPLGWVPKEWTVAGLASAVQKDRSVIRTGPFGSSLKGEHWCESGRPVVTIGSLGDGAFIESELLFIDEKTAQQLVDFELCTGDIAFSRVADVGRSVVITEEQRGWIMSSNFMRISVDSEKARPRLLQLLLASSILVRKQIRMTVNSAGRDVANSAVLMALRFPWPMPEEQDQIIERVESFERKIAMEEAQHQKLLAAKEGLMDDLLSGRVRVTSLLEAAEQAAAPIVHQSVG